MRFFAVIQKCDLEKINDFQTFRKALPREIKFYPETQKDKAIEVAKRIANQSRNIESFIITVDLNQLLKKQALAHINGGVSSETMMPESKVDNWKIARVSKAVNNEWKIEKVKTMFDSTKGKSNKVYPRLNWSIAASILGLGAAYFVGLGFWPVVGLIVLGAVTTTIINKCSDDYVKKHYKTARQIRDVKDPCEQQALLIGKGSTSLFQSMTAFVKPVTWLHPLAYAAGKAHANHHNEKMIKAIESLRRPKT